MTTLWPYLADENFMLVYSYWRDFAPDRALHRVNWAVGDIVNSVAKVKLFDVGDYENLDAQSKKLQLVKIQRWILENSSK